MEQENIVLPITKILSESFKAELKYDITDIDLSSISGSDLISYNRKLGAKFKADNKYSPLDDTDLADELMCKYVKFTYNNERVDVNLLNGASDIKRFQNSHFEEYVEISKLYLNYLVQNLIKINSDVVKYLKRQEMELMSITMEAFAPEVQAKIIGIAQNTSIDNDKKK